MPGIGVILNPNSKQHKRNPGMTRQMGFVVGDKASCKTTEDLADLRRVAEEFKTRDIDILAISGGDGTNQCTLTTFIQVYGEKPLPKIAFLKGGTLNTVASSLGIKGSPDRLLSDLVIKYHEDLPFETKTVTLTRVNDQYGFIFGIGVIYRFMEKYYAGGAPSPTKALILLGRTVGSALFNTPFTCEMFRRFNAVVTANGKSWPYRNYATIFSGSVNEIGMNFRIFHLVDEHPGHFHATGFSMPPRSILRYLPTLYLGKAADCPDLIEAAAREMTIELEEPMPYQLDGNMLGAERLYRLSTGPQLTVIIP